MNATIDSALGVYIPEADEPLQALWDRSPFLYGEHVLAHITILYPFLPPVTIDEQVMATLEAYFAAIPSFTFDLNRVERFPQVLYLAPEPAEPFIRMTEGLTKIYPQLYPYGGVHTEVIPHLTLAKVEDNDHLDDLAETFEPLAEAHLPITAGVEQVWLIEISTQMTGRVMRTFPLGE
jgi:2'-5' RNA ligase